MKIDFKKYSKKQLIIFAIIAVFLIGIIAIGSVSIAKHENPVQLISGVFTSEDQLIGKWQGEKAITGYEFYDDETYDSYISTFAIRGIYTVDGNEITLRSANAGGKVVYKYSISGDKLTLTLVSSNGSEVEDKEEHTFTKVEHFNLKSPAEALQEFADEIQDEEESTSEAEEND